MNISAFAWCTFIVSNMFLSAYIISFYNISTYTPKFWAKLIWVQILLYPIFFPPVSMIFLCWYADHEYRISRKVRIILEYIFVSLFSIWFVITFIYLMVIIIESNPPAVFIVFGFLYLLEWIYILLFCALLRKRKYLNFILPIGWLLLVSR